MASARAPGHSPRHQPQRRATRAIRRRRRPVAVGRDLDVVSQADTLEAFHSVREDLVLTTHAYYLVELVTCSPKSTRKIAPSSTSWSTAFASAAPLRTTPGADQLHHLMEALGYRPEPRMRRLSRQDARAQSLGAARRRAVLALRRAGLGRANRRAPSSCCATWQGGLFVHAAPSRARPKHCSDYPAIVGAGCASGPHCAGFEVGRVYDERSTVDVLVLRSYHRLYTVD
jgi:hypothetical protein